VKLLSLQRIQELAQTQSCCTQKISLGLVDFSKPFIHEHLTQLYFTPAYKTLSFELKLRYNQLYALRVNEQFMMFEKDFINRVIDRLGQSSFILKQEVLCQNLRTMMQEEMLHHESFARLNRHCRPNLYQNSERYFNRFGFWEDRLFRILTHFPGLLVFLLWYIVAMEEYSLVLSRAMFENTSSSLGEIEPHFVTLHKEHFKDEARHIHLDLHLLHQCHPKSKALRTINARLFMMFVKDMMTPKRSGLNLLRHFIQECPELSPKQDELIQQLLALKHNREYLCSMFSRDNMPHSFAFFDTIPELKNLAKILPGAAA